MGGDVVITSFCIHVRRRPAPPPREASSPKGTTALLQTRASLRHALDQSTRPVAKDIEAWPRSGSSDSARKRLPVRTETGIATIHITKPAVPRLAIEMSGLAVIDVRARQACDAAIVRGGRADACDCRVRVDRREGGNVHACAIGSREFGSEEVVGGAGGVEGGRACGGGGDGAGGFTVSARRDGVIKQWRWGQMLTKSLLRSRLGPRFRPSW